MGGMASPLQGLRVKVDKQGRLVLPHAVREGFVSSPGELVLFRTPEGLLLQPSTDPGTVRIADDGLPILSLNRTVTNAEVLAAIDGERSER